jgi:hypothetical protein
MKFIFGQYNQNSDIYCLDLMLQRVPKAVSSGVKAADV